MKSKKRIVCFLNGVTLNNGKPSISGGDVRALKILQELVKRKIQVTIFSSTPGVELIKNFQEKNWEVIDIQTQEKGDILSRINRVWRSYVAVDKWIKDKKTSLGLISYSSCEHVYDVLPAWYLKWKKNIPWVALIHWVPDSPWINNRGNTPFLYNLIFYIQNWFSHVLIKAKANKYLAVSDITWQKLKNIGFNPQKLEVVFCGVDLDKIQAVKTGGTKKYDGVFLKRLNPGKGSYDLVSIWQKVVKKFAKAKLLVIGDGPKDVVEKIKQQITDFGLSKNIILHGPEYDFERKFKLVKQSKVFVLPTYEENWAIVIGEALAAGLPVVCYDLPEIKPIWRDAVRWVEKGNTHAMAKKIIDFLDKKEKATKKLPMVVKKYSWKKVAEREFSLMNECW